MLVPRLLKNPRRLAIHDHRIVLKGEAETALVGPTGKGGALLHLQERQVQILDSTIREAALSF